MIKVNWMTGFWKEADPTYIDKLHINYISTRIRPHEIIFEIKQKVIDQYIHTDTCISKPIQQTTNQIVACVTRQLNNMSNYTIIKII